ncbi:uncharacterized protein LOC130371638 [Gadus chalcogrammus]|uniref:uncharacterized protein LOC130371638 n=1 Tax=Gadus chalcogrammus TaxID=1042646 RepID=UPI0024C4C9E0|nr:uncharacterized protein LOC130371638 [Gadus chalcogrammus]XP_056433453.1 uncharacterized protein LOC130371638 [Gadus chalcogrammus]XP_056433454.1 uncharacterized protein LOC130371638 [Gadus chalcogrammus]XP_056433455.1 uncharacterized protein LOC130371638 [Gadus chalcogrammus]
MERECFTRTMDVLLQELPIKEVVTDAHPQISALLNPERGKYKDWGIQHSLDIWHAAKSLSKRLFRAGSKKENSGLLVWTRDIVNHFWFCSKKAESEEQFKLTWVGVLHHVRNEHVWATGCCEHEPLDGDSRDKPWIVQGSACHKALTAIVLENRFLNLVKKFLNFRTTSDLESFQNHVLMYAAKRMGYTPFVYKTRTLLAAIDYNKHNQRQAARNREGHKMYKRSYNKKSKNWTVSTIKEIKEYSYIWEIQTAILSRRIASGTGLPRTVTMRAGDPRRLGLLAPVQPPPTSELVRVQLARGNIFPENPPEDATQ